MSRIKPTIIGVLSVYPPLMMLGFATWTELDAFPGGTPVMIAMMVSIPLALGLMLYYVRRIRKNEDVGTAQSVTWSLFTLFGNFSALPILWWVHVWRHRSGAEPGSSQSSPVTRADPGDGNGMSRTHRMALGAFSFAPAVLSGLALAVVSLTAPADSTPALFESAFPIFPAMFLIVIATFNLAGYYLYRVWERTDFGKNRRIIWSAVIILANWLSLPFAWYFIVQKQA